MHSEPGQRRGLIRPKRFVYLHNQFDVMFLCIFKTWSNNGADFGDVARLDENSFWNNRDKKYKETWTNDEHTDFEINLFVCVNYSINIIEIPPYYETLFKNIYGTKLVLASLIIEF